MKERKHYIEFVGQHTAGKTVTIHEIVDKSLLAPMQSVYPQQLKRRKIHFALMLPVLFVQNFIHFWFAVIFLLRYTKWNWTNYHAVGRHLLKMVLLHPYYEKHFEFDVWMKDDMLHLLPRIEFRRSVDTEVVLTKFFKHFAYLYEGIVYLDLPYEEMKRRFEERFKERSESRRANREKVYERAFEQNKILKKILVEQKQVPVLLLSGTESTEQNATESAEFIRKVCTKTSGIFVSFLGSRGSGKTTIAQSVQDELERREYSCIRQHSGLTRRPLFRSLVNAVYLWRFFDYELMKVLGFYGRTHRWKPSLYRFYLPLAFACDLNRLALRRGDILLYDSNVLRGLIAAVENGEIKPNFIADFYSRKVLSRAKKVVLVVVETNTEDSVDRWIARDGVTLTEEQYAREVAERQKVAESIKPVVSALEELPDVTVVRLDGSATPKDNASRVITAVTTTG